MLYNSTSYDINLNRVKACSLHADCCSKYDDGTILRVLTRHTLSLSTR